MFRKKTYDQKIYLFTLFLALSLFAIYLINTLRNNALWLDESFSIGIIKHSYADIVNITAIDVHPPLYYILYKFFFVVVSGLGLPFSAVIAGKLFSLGCFLILLLISLIIKKEFGSYSASIFVLMLIALPNIFYSAIDIRMYMLAMLTVTLTYISGYYIIKNNSPLWYLGLLIFGLLSSYTHYYACLACVFIYLIVLIDLVKLKRRLLPFILTSLVMIIAYLPWLVVLIRQFKTVSDGYWIPTLDQATIVSWFSFFLYPFKDSAQSFIFLLLIISTALISFVKMLRNHSSIQINYGMIGVLLPFLIIGLGYSVSVIDRPLYFDRYILPCIGVFALGYAVMMKAFTHNRIFKLVPIIVFSLTAIYTNIDIVKMETKRAAQAIVLEDELNDLGNQDDIIFENSQIQRTVSIMTNANTYLFEPGTSTLSHLVYNNVYDYTGYPMIDEALNNNHYVYFVPQEGSEQMVEFAYNGYQLTKIGSYQLEGYFFDIYNVSKE